MNQNDNNLCFVIMPFSTEFKNQWELAYVPAIKESDLIPYRGDEEALGTNIIMRDVTQCIYNAKLIIADLTYRNPNVMYELGLAHSAKKPVIVDLNFLPLASESDILTEARFHTSCILKTAYEFTSF